MAETPSATRRKDRAVQHERRWYRHQRATRQPDTGHVWQGNVAVDKRRLLSQPQFYSGSLERRAESQFLQMLGVLDKLYTAYTVATGRDPIAGPCLTPAQRITDGLLLGFGALDDNVHPHLPQVPMGRYRLNGGHHVHAKAAFRPPHDDNAALTLTDDFLQSLSARHRGEQQA